MRYAFDGFNYFIRLDKGERLSESLETFMRETKIDGAWVSAIGGALEVTLGFYDLDKKQYQWRTLNGLYEITGLQGNLARDESGTMMFHLHGTLSDAHYRVVGGHVKDLVAAATVEIFVHRAYLPLNRKTDPQVGLQTLDLHAGT